MSENKDDFFENFDEISRQAKQEADRKVASKIASRTQLKEGEIRTLFPKPADQEKLAELVEIVKSADEHNQKVNRLVQRAEDFAGIVVRLLGRYI